jgi:hypothetical protein
VDERRPLVSLRGVTLGYSEPVLRGVDLTIYSGDLIGMEAPTAPVRQPFSKPSLGSYQFSMAPLEQLRSIRFCSMFPEHCARPQLSPNCGEVVEMGSYGRLRLTQRMRSRRKRKERITGSGWPKRILPRSLFFFFGRAEAENPHR